MLLQDAHQLGQPQAQATALLGYQHGVQACGDALLPQVLHKGRLAAVVRAQLLVAAIVGKQACGHVSKGFLIVCQFKVHSGLEGGPVGSGGIWHGPKLWQHQIAVIGVKFNVYFLADAHIARCHA